MKITRRQLRRLVSESMDLASPMERMFLQELGASFYSEYDGARTGRGIFHEKFPNNCLVRFDIGRGMFFLSPSSEIIVKSFRI